MGNTQALFSPLVASLDGTIKWPFLSTAINAALDTAWDSFVTSGNGNNVAYSGRRVR